ncbi:ECF transporter S component [Parasphaerochaeta coccoides]|uniref:ECF transporter S component n=1 Tax=Parasphaerochaeta coccoides (strain ATCC BAA-1237 / DSM 17374 / SPN1) TaxID=760011 RepID=F4GM56_PARC1|nr:ECF transporter S component [Parasphaerochaeta coccoides]AEC02531.1 protein of unknown function DUF1393 [Parasphaerochaeta coccoides DSM 17374]
MEQRNFGKGALFPAIIAVLGAVTFVFTSLRIPTIGGLGGYIHLGDVAVCFAAYAFGPWTAFLAGGLGTALADVIGPFAQWAPVSFITHGLQGAVTALVARAFLRQGCRRDGKEGIRKTEALWSWPGVIVSGLLSMVIVAGGYFLGGGLLVGFAAAVPEIPLNLLQSGTGVVGGALLSRYVIRAYPPVKAWRW